MKIHLAVVFTLILSLFAHGAAAEIEEIVVTSEFRPSTLQTLPASISVVDMEAAEGRAAQHIEEILGLIPNLNFAAGSSRARFFQIRGIGERSQFTEPVNSSVGFIIDDIDFSAIGSAGTLFDIDRVEVLRGPQGVLYGANALAGTIRLETVAPRDVGEFSISGQVAEFGTGSLGVIANVPLLKDKLLARLSVQQYQSDGFTTNTFLDRDDVNERDELTARLKLRWLASEDLTIDTTIHYIDIDNGYDAFSLDNDRFTRSDSPGRDAQESTAISIRTMLDTDGGYQIETILTAADTDVEYSFDEDWTFDGFDPIGFTSFDQYLRDRKNYSAELRFVSDQSGRLFNDSTDWVVGLYHLSTEEDLTRIYTFLADDFISQYDTSATALYAQFESDVADRLTLITGLRAEFWEADYSDNVGISNDPDETLLGGKIGLQFQINPDHMVYGHVARGFKAGGTNNNGNLVGTSQPLDFDTEFQNAWELGHKGQWLDGNLQTRLALFFTNRKDQQVRSSIQVPIPGEAGATQFIDLTTNAASGENYGLEAELNWALNDSFQLNASLGLLQATFDEYFAPPTQTDPDGLDLSGQDQAQSPEYQFSIGGKYHFYNGFFAEANIEGKDGFFFSDRHRSAADSYEIVNARVGYENDNWAVSLWGRNLGDVDIETRGFGSFGNDPRNFYAPDTYVQFGEPRIIGVSFKYDL